MPLLSNEEQKAAEKKIWTACAESLRPPKFLLPSEWATVHRYLSKEANVKGGKWRNMPMQVAPMDSVMDPEVSSTVVMWSSQTAGKTEMILNLVGYFIDHDPSSILLIQPDLNLAEAWSKERFTPMVRDTPILSEIINLKTRESSNTILHKSYPGGHITIAGANSPASLAMRPIRANFFDEVDRFPASAGVEGDPISLAEKRSDTFFNSVSFKTSTPTIKGHSRIEKEFLSSDQNFWHVKCHKCKVEQTLKWRQVRWPSIDRLKETHYICENKRCNAKWDQEKLTKGIREGHWVAMAPFKGIRGYHLNGIYSLLRPKKTFVSRLHQAAVEFLDAKRKGKQTLKAWTNTFLAETWQDEADAKPEWHSVFSRRESYTDRTVPNGVRLISASADFHDDRVEMEFVGHGLAEETWGLGHHVFFGDAKKIDIYNRLESALQKTFVREDGAQLRVGSAGFDTGYHGSQRELYAWLRPRLARSYYAFKGSSKRNAEPIGMASKSKVEAVRLFLIGTNRIKAYIYAHISIAVAGPGYMHFSDNPEMGYNEEYFKQLLVEESTTVHVAGTSFKEFKMPDVVPDGFTTANEAIDLRVYAQAALYVRGMINWDLVERRNLLTIPQEGAATDSPPAPTPSPFVKPQRQERSQQQPPVGRREHVPGEKRKPRQPRFLANLMMGS